MIQALWSYPNESLNGYDKAFNANQWLYEKGNYLATYKIDGLNCANLIDNACFEYNINQRAMIMTLQREQQGIELGGIVRAVPPDPNKEPDVLDWATGCAKFDDGTSWSKYKGFKAQVYGAGSTYRLWFDYYMKHSTPDGLYAELVKPDVEPGLMSKSAVTFALIKYTPHFDVLKLNANIWKRYFIESQV